MTLLQIMPGRPRAGEDRRRLPRAPLHLPVRFREVASPQPAPGHGITLDVSRSGVRFRSPAFLAARTFVALDVTLPSRATYRARGRVVWMRQARGAGHWEVGAEFLRSDADADAALAEALLFTA